VTRLVPGPLEGVQPFAHESSPAAGFARRRRRRETRGRAQRRRFVDRVAATVARLADARGWERLLVSGPDRLTGPLVAALPTSLIESVIRDSRHVVELDSPALAAAVDERLEAEHSQREVQLAQATLDGASGAAGVALGLSEVLAALNDARVAHLVARLRVNRRDAVVLPR
jgi:Bacterial archaeo-eukaryotic release factor family 10